MQFRFIKLAENGTPIAETDSYNYRHSYFFINGMTVKKWHELDMTVPKRERIFLVIMI